MSFVNTITSLLILAVVSGSLPETVRVTDPFQITPYIQEKTILKDVKPIPLRRSCGGAGRVIQTRYEECNTGGTEICVTSHEGSGRGEMVFVPSVSSRGLGFIFRIFTTVGGKPTATILERQFPDVSFVAAQEYVITAVGGPTPELKGKHVTSQWEIYRMVDRQVEACSEQDFFVL